MHIVNIIFDKIKIVVDLRNVMCYNANKTCERSVLFVNEEVRKLKGKMAENGVTQRKLAEVLGTVPSVICKKMKTGNFSMVEIRKISEYLKVPVNELFNIERSD